MSGIYDDGYDDFGGGFGGGYGRGGMGRRGGMKYVVRTELDSFHYVTLLVHFNCRPRVIL